ncbi:MAG: ABC transporter substrate-binding protein [Acidimicrobiales bacterium]
MASVLACALAAALGTAACGGGSGQATKPTTGSTATAGGGGTTTSTAGGGKAGGTAGSGTLVVASAVAPPTLDLTSNPAAAIDEVLDYNVYQHLVELDPKGKVIPVLATKYAVSPDGLTYTFTVRGGVKFSNGDAMTPADVVSSLKRVIAPGSKYPYGKLLADVKSVSTSGADQVVVKLSHPDNQFLYDLAAYSNGVVLDPKAIPQIATHPVGTGPYVFQSYRPNYSVSLARNPTYWGTKPGVAKVTFRYFSSANAENSALKSGQVQVIDNLENPQDAAQFKANSSFKVIAGPTNGKIQMTLNNAAGPLSKQAVRQAISYATDKQAILKTVAAGYGTVIGSDDVPGDPWYLPSLAGKYPYNPTKAKKLLAGAGYPNGFSATLVLPPYGYASGAGPLLQAELAAVGIKTKITNVQFPLWLSQVFTHSNFQMTVIDHVEARDIANYANCSYYWKFAGCKKVAGMLTAATQATTTAAEVAGFEKVAKLIADQAVNDFLYNPDQVTVAKANVVGLPGSGLTESFDLGSVSIGGTLSSTARSQGYAP